MKIIEVENSKLASLIGYHITLYPFIFYAGVPDKRTRKHEMVHIGQIQKLGFIRFYASYLSHYVKNRIAGMSAYEAYRAIPYEVEAYAREGEDE